jgi:hypothetical protein
MKTQRVFWLGLLIVFSAAHALGADEVKKNFPVPDTQAGASVSIPGTFPGTPVRQVVLENTQADGPSPPPIGATVSEGVLTFTLPNDLPSGRYRVKIKLGEAPIDAGELRVPRLADVQVTIATVRPVSPYPNPNPVAKPTPTPGPNSSPAPSPSPFPKQYNFEIAGTNFSPDLKNNHIEIDNVPITTPPCVKDGDIPCLGSEPGSETRKLIVYHFSPPGFSRSLAVSVRVGTGPNVAKAPALLVFSGVSESGLRFYALGAFIILLGILLIVVRGAFNRGKSTPEKYGWLKSFVLEKETNSYSLSKLQLTLFTLVTVFGYIYVFICTLLVQWKFELPPVPENLPGMMAISLGTSVVTAGIGSRIGGKGAGPTSPSLADFITSGGVVLPERFQFFVWTLVTVGGVLVLLLAQDPVTLTQLPKLPDGMLYLMGLSSAGYLGGKLARGPGPSVKSLDVQLLPGNVVQFAIHGDNLSSKATFQLDEEHIPGDQVQIGQKPAQGQNLELCNMLEVKLSNVAQRYLDGPHIFRIVNPDSQGADFKYGATIESVTAIKDVEDDYSKTDTNFIVRGTNFKDPSSAQWIDAARIITKLGAEKVTKKSETVLVVSLPLGTVPVLLSILSPGELRTTFDLVLGAQVETPTATAPTVDDNSKITKVDVSETDAEDGKAYTALEATLTGDNLSSEATFQLDGEPVSADQVRIVDKKIPAPRDPKLWTSLKVHLRVDPRFYDGPRVLRITNPDSQGADFKYGATIESAVIELGSPPDAGFKIRVKGAKFQDSSSGSWKSDAADSVATDIPVADIAKKSDSELEVTVRKDAPSGGTLTIKGPAGLTTTVDVTVAGEEEEEGSPP